MSKKFYYDEDNFKLLHGDTILLLKKIEPQSIDMIFADTEYNKFFITIIFFPLFFCIYTSIIKNDITKHIYKLK